MTRVLLGAIAIISVTGAFDARALAPLSGRFSSPLGAVSISEKNGEVRGTLLDGKNPCGFKKGAVVLEGSRLDDSVIGTLRACKLGDGCSGPLEGAAMLLITKKGAVISGAVHLEAGACKTPMSGDAIVFRKSERPAVAAAPAAPVLKSTKRERAEALAREAQQLLTQTDSNAEAARAKLQESIKVDPEYAEGFLGVGVTYFMRDRYEEALDWYKQALEVNPGLGDAYYNIACVYALRGDKPQALRYLRIALLNGYVQLQTLQSDPDLKGLAGDETFERFKQGLTDAPAPPPPPPPPPAAAPVDAGPAADANAAAIDRAPGK
jgi:Tetratricopeptide repeat